MKRGEERRPDALLEAEGRLWLADGADELATFCTGAGAGADTTSGVGFAFFLGAGVRRTSLDFAASPVDGTAGTLDDLAELDDFGCGLVGCDFFGFECA